MADQTNASGLCGVDGDYTEALLDGLFRTEPVPFGPCQDPATETARFLCERGHILERVVCPGHMDVLTRPQPGDGPLCARCFQETGEDVPITPLIETPARDRAEQPWRCPNDPPCEHPRVLHLELEGDPSAICWAADCSCDGSPKLLPQLAAATVSGALADRAGTGPAAAKGSKIEWTDDTWDPLEGCTPVSKGCDNCYAARLVGTRFRHLPLYAGLAEGGVFTGVVRLVPERLDQPLRWRRPRLIFVDSRADLFHDKVPDEFIARVFAVMAMAPHHTFQVLTKRHARMRAVLSSPEFHSLVAAAAPIYGRDPDLAQDYVTTTWPLPNVWLGVSVETQQWADIRIPALLDTPAAVRWLSCEPLLGPVDLAGYLPRRADAPWYPVECRHGYDGCPLCDRALAPADAISWLVVGGESGPGARPMHPAWARSLRDQAVRSGVPFHFKQHGAWVPVRDNPRHGDNWVARDGTTTAWSRDDGRSRVGGGDWRLGDKVLVRNVGKKAAGRELDGHLWDQYPAGAVA